MAKGGMAALLGMSPEAIAEKLLRGDFGKALAVWVNKHQKGNKWLMETLTSQPYAVPEITTDEMFQSVQGEEGAAGLGFILERLENQQKDVVRVVNAMVQRGKEVKAQMEAEARAAGEASIHGPVGKTVEVADVDDEDPDPEPTAVSEPDAA